MIRYGNSRHSDSCGINHPTYQSYIEVSLQIKGMNPAAKDPRESVMLSWLLAGPYGTSPKPMSADLNCHDSTKTKDELNDPGHMGSLDRISAAASELSGQIAQRVSDVNDGEPIY